MDAEHLRETYNKYFTEGGPSWSSADLKKTRKVVRRTLSWLRGYGLKKNKLNVLDVGCATGFYTEAFRQLGNQALGLDYSEIALEKAKTSFPECRFIQMNGFEPFFKETFDVIFCRGFSGANTHDIHFIAQWINRYMICLNPGGYFILSYSTNFSGKEKEGETVNLSLKELHDLASLILGTFCGIKLFHYFGPLSWFKKLLERKVLNKERKEYFSLFIRKA